MTSEKGDSAAHDPFAELVRQSVFRVGKRGGWSGQHYVRHMGWTAQIEVDGEVRPIIATRFHSNGTVTFVAGQNGSSKT